MAATRKAPTTERRSTTLSAGLVLLAILVLGNATSLAAPIPVPVIVISVGLAIAGLIAILGIWTGRARGRWAGAGIAIATALAAAPGIFASGQLSYVAGATVVIGLACALLLLLPESGRSVRAAGEEV